MSSNEPVCTTSEEVLFDSKARFDDEKIFKEAIQYAECFYYSKPLTKHQIGNHAVDIIPGIHKLSRPIHVVETDSYRTRQRLSHGILHVIEAAELIEKIHEQYTKAREYNPAEKDLQDLAAHFNLSSETLLTLVKIAAIFHDSGRKGDGIDLWDEESANNLENYLSEKSEIPGLNKNLVKLLSHTIRYKDDTASFYKACLELGLTVNMSLQADYLRQLLNNADTLEVLRCRDFFDPQYMPLVRMNDERLFNLDTLITARALDEQYRFQYIFRQCDRGDQAYKYRVTLTKYINNKSYLDDNKLEQAISDLKNTPRTDETLCQTVTTNCVVPHRDLIHQQGRLNPRYKHEIVGIENKNYDQATLEAENLTKIASHSETIYENYELTVYQKGGQLDFEKAVTRAHEGIWYFLHEAPKSGPARYQEGHYKFFPDHYGKSRRKKAERFQTLFNAAESQEDKALILFTLVANNDTTLLADEVMGMMGDSNVDKLKEGLKGVMQISDENRGEMRDKQKAIMKYITGKSKEIPDFLPQYATNQNA